MFRTSSILKNARQDKDLTITEVAKKIKIAAKYLEAIESEDQKAFPQEPYCSLIVKDYADFLGLNGQEILKFFHRDFDPKKPKTTHSKSSFFSLTPQLAFTVSLIAMILVFSTYLLYEYLKYNQPPNLKVNWPETTVTGPVFELTGKTNTEATVRVNDDLVIVDHNGNFSKKIQLTSSQIKIKVESRSPSGRTSVVERDISAN